MTWHNGDSLSYRSLDDILNDLRIKSEVWMNGNLGNRSYKRIANYDSP